MITEVFSLDKCPNRARDSLFSGSLRELRDKFQGSAFIVHEFQPNQWAMWDDSLPWKSAETRGLFEDLRR